MSTSQQAVTGRPYSGEEVTERVQTLADGTRITQTTLKVLTWRDSQGRLRNERQFVPPPGSVMGPMPVMIEILDPVAGYRYMLDQNSHTARRFVWPPDMHRGGQAATNKVSGTPFPPPPPPPPPPYVLRSNSHRAPDVKQESLGSQTMEGLLVEGSHVTTTHPQGSVGNDRPFSSVSERWTSPDLKILVFSKDNDPRTGESTVKLNNVVQTEPDPSLFQIPADYKILDTP